MTTRPYVDRPVADRDLASAVARRLADRWGLPTPEPLRHGMNALYTCGDVVLRIGATSAPADRSHALASWLIECGVPTIRPVAGLVADADGFAITGWERVEPIAEPVDWVAIGRAVRRVHSLPFEQVPVGYPVPDPSSFPWWDFDGMLAELSDAIDDAALSGLRAALRRGAGWQRDIARGAVLCHGDVHPGNVLMTVDGPLLIDWDLLCVANPAWDHAMLTTYADRWGGDPAVLAGFTAGYGDPGVDRALAARLGELRNVAATLMRAKLGSDDPAVAEEAERRLRYWRGDPTAPTWRAQ